MLHFGLSLPKRLEKLRMNAEPHLGGLTARFPGGGSHFVRESLFEKFLKVVVGDADGQQAVFQGKSRVSFEPGFIPLVSDALGNCLSQRGHDIMIGGKQRSSPGAESLRLAS